MPSANDILKHKLAGLTDEQRGKLAEMLLEDSDRHINATRNNAPNFMAEQIRRDNEQLINTLNQLIDKDGERHCKRYSGGSCLDGDFVDKCVGMDVCGAYEPGRRAEAREQGQNISFNGDARRRRVYISIPISGMDVDAQKRKAASKAEWLKSMGYDVFNPFDVPDPMPELNSKQKYAYYMGRDIEQLMLCDAIFLCRGWRGSKGCSIEKSVADRMELDVMFER